MSRKPKPLPDLKYLKECFELDPNSISGLVWRIRPQEHFKNQDSCNRFNTRFAHKSVGSIHKDLRHIKVGIAGVSYVTHRILYVLYHEIENLDCNLQIDHIDRNSFNNSIDNLRPATPEENMRNRATTKATKSGVRNVYKHAQGWIVMLMINKKLKSFGIYQTIEEASVRAKEMSLELYGEFSPFYKNDEEML